MCVRTTPTHLQFLVTAPQEHPRHAAHCVPSVPPCKGGLPELWVHRVLHAPDVVAGAVRRELLPHHARVWPGAGACTRHNSICGGEEIGVFGGGDGSRGDHVTMRIVVVLELSRE